MTFNWKQNRYLTALEFSTVVAKLLIEIYFGSNIRCLMSDIIKCRHRVSGKTNQRFHDIYPRLTQQARSYTSNEALTQRVSDWLVRGVELQAIARIQVQFVQLFSILGAYRITLLVQFILLIQFPDRAILQRPCTLLFCQSFSATASFSVASPEAQKPW